MVRPARQACEHDRVELPDRQDFISAVRRCVSLSINLTVPVLLAVLLEACRPHAIAVQGGMGNPCLALPAKIY